jgi:hypothetical protein
VLVRRSRITLDLAMIYLSSAVLLLSLLILIPSLNTPIFVSLRPTAKWAALASAIGLMVSFTLSVVSSPERHGNSEQSTAEELEAERQAAETKAAEAERTKAAEAEKRRQDEEIKAATAARRAELLRPPTEQVRFIQTIEHACLQYKSGQNDFQKGAARPARAQLICAVLKSPRIEAWIGTIDTLSTIGAGDGVLTIKIADKVTVGTWNNSASDKLHNTLIKSKFSLYQDLLQIKTGDTVRIYGQLFPRDADCYWEMNSTLAKSLVEPAWVMRFSRIERVDLTGF